LGKLVGVEEPVKTEEAPPSSIDGGMIAKDSAIKCNRDRSVERSDRRYERETSFLEISKAYEGGWEEKCS
jgi:hypothetical protein